MPLELLTQHLRAQRLCARPRIYDQRFTGGVYVGGH